MESTAERSTQQGSSITAECEISALEKLTKAKCSSTPMLLAADTKTPQPEDLWVENGYYGLILMNKLLGARIKRITELDPQEREEMRQSFKKAWK